MYVDLVYFVVPHMSPNNIYFHLSLLLFEVTKRMLLCQENKKYIK